jgi:hypothetical protein
MSIEDLLLQPEQIDAMHAAFVIACAKLRLRLGSSESDRVALRADCGEKLTRESHTERWQHRLPIASGCGRRWAAQVARILEAAWARVGQRDGDGLAQNRQKLVHGLLLACQRQPGGGDRERQVAMSRIAPFSRRQAFRRVRAVALRVVQGNSPLPPRPNPCFDLPPADDAKSVQK